jgi:hypothetical protein
LKILAAALLAWLLITLGPARGHPQPFPKPWLKAALCIQSKEGSWRDPGAPYYGGMQMDIGFQRTYGPHLLRRKGTADKWTPHEQLHVARRGYLARGWYPWPNTARKCGLL